MYLLCKYNKKVGFGTYFSTELLLHKGEVSAITHFPQN